MNNHNVPEVVHPALFPTNIDPDTSNRALFWQGNAAPQLAGRRPVVPSGGILGGGSSINWMVYTRAQRSDFDSWNAPGWSANELYPFLKKVRMRSSYFYFIIASRFELQLLYSLKLIMGAARRSTMATMDLSTSPAVLFGASVRKTSSSTPQPRWATES